MGLFKKKKEKEAEEIIQANTIDVSTGNKVEFESKKEQVVDKPSVSPEIELTINRLNSIYNVDIHPFMRPKLDFAMLNELIEVKVLIAEQNQLLKELLVEVRK